MSERLFILGAGRAGLALACALRASGVDVVGVHGRHGAGGPDGISVGPIPHGVRGANVVLIAVRDAQIDDAVKELETAGIAAGTVVLHASGSAEPTSLDELRARGIPCGTFHPLLPLADPSRAAEMFKGAWIGIDGDPAARETSRVLAARLGAQTLAIPPGGKARYHAAAVLASNFPVVLLALAEQVLSGTGIDADHARRALRPLFHAAAENVGSRSAAEALTGPVVRGDVGTVRAHLQALRDEPNVLDAYRVLARAAIAVAREAGTDAAKLEEIRDLLG